MIITNETYNDFGRNILKRIPIIRTIQMMVCYKNKFPELNDKQKVYNALLELQRQGYALLSEDGWIMTRGAYIEITGDKFLDNCTLNQQIRIKTPMTDLVKDVYSTYSTAMWIISDMMPLSEDFMFSMPPWDVEFITKTKEGKLYQIAYFDHAKIDLKTLLFNDLPNIQSDSMKQRVVRIAVVEDSEDAVKIPYNKGFAYVIKENLDSKTGYQVVDERKQNIWMD